MGTFTDDIWDDKDHGCHTSTSCSSPLLKPPEHVISFHHTATLLANSSVLNTLAAMSTPVPQCPPTLQADGSYQVLPQWCQTWHNFAVMVELQNMPRKQLIQLCTCISLDTQKVLEHIWAFLQTHISTWMTSLTTFRPISGTYEMRPFTVEIYFASSHAQGMRHLNGAILCFSWPKTMLSASQLT